MEPEKRLLLEHIDRDRELLTAFFQEFIRCPSPNPPGDTRMAARHVQTLLDTHGVAYRVIAPNSIMPNIVANFAAHKPGRHLALNGHIDVFPVGSGEGWTRDPWGGDLVDGKIYGRGACDMKAGTTASLFTFLYLREMREALHGQMTLSIVSDEETFGPWGARYLFEHHPEVIGDCCLNGEPSSPHTLRFGEKGKLWLKFRIRTAGAHGAYTHMSRSATAIAAEVMGELATLVELPVARVNNIAAVLDQAAPAIDQAYGRGASEILQRVTVNVGLIHGGLKVNMVAAECDFEVDIRLPIGVTAPAVLAEVDRIVARHPEISYVQDIYDPPSWNAPDTEMVEIVRSNARALAGIDPTPVVSLGGTDARLWRYKDVPATVYGPSPTGMGGVDEHVTVEQFLHVVRCHVLSAFDYMSRGAE
jgi:succinyl-diaminopimelate desuccinylase